MSGATSPPTLSLLFSALTSKTTIQQKMFFVRNGRKGERKRERGEPLSFSSIFSCLVAAPVLLTPAQSECIPGKWGGGEMNLLAATLNPFFMMRRSKKESLRGRTKSALKRSGGGKGKLIDGSGLGKRRLFSPPSLFFFPPPFLAADAKLSLLPPKLATEIEGGGFSVNSIHWKVKKEGGEREKEHEKGEGGGELRPFLGRGKWQRLVCGKRGREGGREARSQLGGGEGEDQHERREEWPCRQLPPRDDRGGGGGGGGGGPPPSALASVG